MRGTQFAELSVFVAVAEEMSFTKAARRLGLSNATLSQAVRALEERLGTRLLNRTTRSVALTDAGERLLTQLRPALDGFDAAIESVNAFRDRPAGHLRLTMSPAIAKFIVAPLLGRFLKQYPDITMEISIGLQFTDIVAGRFDAGFSGREFIPRDMVAIRISENIRRVVVASPDYLRQHGQPLAPADLHNHNCIRFRLGDGSFLPWMFRADEKEFEVHVTGSFEINDSDLAIAAAVSDLGLTYTLEEYVSPLIDDGRLVRVLEKEMMPHAGPFFMFYPSRRQNSAALRALIDFLQSNLRSCKRAAKDRVASAHIKVDARGAPAAP
jgi:DNA-binding transcriptional LysR family regulator